MKNHWSAVWLSGLLGLSAVLLPLLSGAQDLRISPSPASRAISMDQVAVAHPGEQTTVRVAGSGQLSYHVSRLADPPRLVVDFDGAHIAAARNTASNAVEPVVNVRLGQSSPDRVRLVIDLAHPSGYAVTKDGQDFVVTFANAAAQSSSKPSGKLIATAPKAAAPGIAVLPISPVDAVVTLADPKPDANELSSSAKPAPAQPSPNPTTAPVVPQDQAATQPVTPPARYTGEPISVNLKDVDVKDFFRLIHEISGLNVVLDPSVGGSLTLVLDEVPWDQALDIVLRNNGLAKQLDGNVLRIAGQQTLRKEAEDRLALNKAISEAVEPVTSTRVLSYAKAGEMVAPLRRFLSSRGDIIAETRTNTLIIKDIPAVMPQIDSLIRQLDRKTPQVEIQARVVEASRTFARDIGTQFGFAVTANQGRNIVGGAPIVGASPIIQPIPTTLAGTGASIPLVSNFGANAPSSGLSFSYTGNNLAIDYIITAAESKGVGKLLSSPQLVTQNNAQAVVKQGTQIPIQTTVNNTISTQYVDAVLKLQVTPQITADGTVFLDVEVENTQVDNGIPAINGIPALSTESAQTKVLIGDGGTVVIGGVMVSTQQTNEFEVPLVGSIPLIGHLFKRNEVSIQSQELLFFVTPRILPS